MNAKNGRNNKRQRLDDEVEGETGRDRRQMASQVSMYG
jgi:hypothetical protein